MTPEERRRELDALAIATLQKWASRGSRRAAALLRRFAPTEDSECPGLAGNDNATAVAQKRAKSASKDD